MYTVVPIVTEQSKTPQKTKPTQAKISKSNYRRAKNRIIKVKRETEYYKKNKNTVRSKERKNDYERIEGGERI